jgi:hypothetical protein
MSIEAMKQAVKALEYAAGLISPITKGCQCQICLAHTTLRQAIEEVEKQGLEHSIEVRCFGPHISFITREPMSQYKDGDCFYRIKKEKNT